VVESIPEVVKPVNLVLICDRSAGSMFYLRYVMISRFKPPRYGFVITCKSKHHNIHNLRIDFNQLANE